MNGRSITHSSQAAIKQVASLPPPSSLGRGRGSGGGSSSICICASHLPQLAKPSMGTARPGTLDARG